MLVTPLVAKRNNLTSAPESHMVEAENLLLFLICSIHMYMHYVKNIFFQLPKNSSVGKEPDALEWTGFLRLAP